VLLIHAANSGTLTGSRTEHHSKSYRMATSLLQRMRKRIFKSKPVGAAESNLEEGTKRRSDVKYHSSFNFLGPPNLQLNASSGQSSRENRAAELFTAAVIALVLQLSLLVIAAVTVYHEPTKTAIGYNPRSYGLPSYVGGSVFLFIGMAICSFAIESSSAEFMWERRGRDDKPADPEDVEAEAPPPDTRSIAKRILAEFRGKTATTEMLGSEYPRLIWLQKSQTVNDQDFDSYVILGGSKRYVLTSSRQEDVKACERRKTAEASSKLGNAHHSETTDMRADAVTRSDSESESDMSQQQMSDYEAESVSFPQRHGLGLR
jgi:hypothetical protein